MNQDERAAKILLESTNPPPHEHGIGIHYLKGCSGCQKLARRRQRKRNRSLNPKQRRVNQEAGVVPSSYAARTAWLNSIKMASGCVDCGYRQAPEALDFDHIDPATKSFPISQGKLKPFWTLKAEVEKCEVRCANCHRIKTTRDGTRGGRPRKKS